MMMMKWCCTRLNFAAHTAQAMLMMKLSEINFQTETTIQTNLTMGTIKGAFELMYPDGTEDGAINAPDNDDGSFVRAYAC